MSLRGRAGVDATLEGSPSPQKFFAVQMKKLGPGTTVVVRLVLPTTDAKGCQLGGPTTGIESAL